MQTAPIPGDEEGRLTALHKLAILDTKPEKRFDDLTKEATEKLQVPISTISIIDSKREWYKSCQGLNQKEGSREVSFCGHALLSKYIFIVQDTLKDPRFADNPMVIGEPYIRFYAGIALHENETDKPIGVFCVKDIKPRQLSIQEVGILVDIADRAEKELNKK
ncbi:MAG: GAF domain-containing protein [Candidatus Paceibacterota bacterium]|jgi:GAF domain-containing protein